MENKIYRLTLISVLAFVSKIKAFTVILDITHLNRASRDIQRVFSCLSSLIIL